MSCTRCGQPVCCCIKKISTTGKRGPRGPRGPKGPGPFIESGTFEVELAETIYGISATGATVGGNLANPTLTITTTKKLKLLHINCVAEQTPTIASYGKDDGVNADCFRSNDTPSAGSTQTDSIVIFPASGNGYAGKVTQINKNTFVITLTQLGSGSGFIGQWHAIEE